MRDRSFHCNLRSNVSGIEDPHSWSWERETYPEWSQHERNSLAASFGSVQREDRGWGFELPKYTWVLRIDRAFWPGDRTLRRLGSGFLRKGGTRGFRAFFGWHVRGWGCVWMLYAKGRARSLNEAARVLEPSFDLRESMIRLGKVIYSQDAFSMCHPFKFGYKRNKFGWEVKDENSIGLLGHGWMQREADGGHGLNGGEVLPIARDSFNAHAVMIEKRVPSWWSEKERTLAGHNRYPSFHWGEHGGHSSGPIGDIKTVTDFFASAIASSTIEAD